MYRRNRMMSASVTVRVQTADADARWRLIGRSCSECEWARRNSHASVAVGNDSWKSVCFGAERPSIRRSSLPSFRRTAAAAGRSESHGRPTLSIYSFANAICRRRLFESITPSELLRSADVGRVTRDGRAANKAARPAGRLDALCTPNNGARLDKNTSSVYSDEMQHRPRRNTYISTLFLASINLWYNTVLTCVK